MPLTKVAATPILIHDMVMAATTSESSERPYVTKMEWRCFIITATARSTEPVGPCSASRCPYTVAKLATHTV